LDGAHQLYSVAEEAEDPGSDPGARPRKEGEADMSYRVVEIRGWSEHAEAIDDFVKDLSELIGKYRFDVEWEIRIVNEEIERKKHEA